MKISNQTVITGIIHKYGSNKDKSDYVILAKFFDFVITAFNKPFILPSNVFSLSYKLSLYSL